MVEKYGRTGLMHWKIRRWKTVTLEKLDILQALDMAHFKVKL